MDVKSDALPVMNNNQISHDNVDTYSEPVLPNDMQKRPEGGADSNFERQYNELLDRQSDERKENIDANEAP